MEEIMKKLLSLTMVITACALLSPVKAHAYIDLCCGKCGGIPETHEFRFKIQPMIMHMAGLMMKGESQ